MRTEYMRLLLVNEEDFTTDALFQLAVGAQRFLEPIAKLVEELKTPHSKFLIKMVEQTLRCRFDSDLRFIFDQDKAEMAVLVEMVTETTTDQNRDMEMHLVELAKYFKCEASKLTEENKFEAFVAKNLYELVTKFRETLLEPMRFHNFKAVWLKNFNDKRMKSRIPVAQ